MMISSPNRLLSSSLARGYPNSGGINMQHSMTHAASPSHCWARRARRDASSLITRFNVVFKGPDEVLVAHRVAAEGGDDHCWCLKHPGLAARAWSLQGPVESERVSVQGAELPGGCSRVVATGGTYMLAGGHCLLSG